MIKLIIVIVIVLVAFIGTMRKSDEDKLDVEKPGPIHPPSTDQA